MTLGLGMSIFGMVASLFGLVGSVHQVKAWWTSYPWLAVVLGIILSSMFIS